MFFETLQAYQDKGLIMGQQHPTLPLTIWNYTNLTQYEGRWDDVTMMCRGLVTHSFNGHIYARPMKKFFNLEEKRHTPTSEFDVYEKMDGSLILLFWYKDQWVVASRGSFTSEQAVGAKRLFDKMFLDGLPKNYTYVFEFIAPWNRIVVDYGDVTKLVLLTACNVENGVEPDYAILQQVAKSLNVEIVKKYDGLKDVDSLKNLIKDNHEGFVVKYSNGQRVKIKSEEYLRLHEIMTNVSTKSVWEYLSGGQTLEDLVDDVPDEFYKKVKDYEKELNEQYEYIEKTIKSLYKKIMLEKPESDKDYAMLVKKHYKPYWSVLFNMRYEQDYSEKIWNLIKPEFKKL